MRRHKPDLLMVLAFLLGLGVVVTSYGAGNEEKVKSVEESRTLLSKRGK